MKKMGNQVGICDFCHKIKINNTYYVYNIGFWTNIKSYSVGILHISEELGDFLMQRGSHLSATQVILLRPDIMLEFLRKKYNKEHETVINFSLNEAEICSNCFKEYNESVPEK